MTTQGLLSRRDSTVDALRGVAAMLVVFRHILRPDVLGVRWFHSFNMGRMGVQLFFVISGFVIGAILVDANAPWRDVPRFMIRRMVRLAPPYTVATLLALALLILFKHVHPAGAFAGFRVETLLCSLSYSCYPLGLPSYLAVGWSLEIEVQFYLIAACLMPFVLRTGRAGAVLVAVGLLAIGWVVPYTYAPCYAAPFLVGMAIVAYRRGALGLPVFIVVSLGLCAYWGVQLRMPEIGAVMALGALAIALQWRLPSVLTWIGGISYSLYLVHLPLGSSFVSGVRWIGLPMAGAWGWFWCTVAIAGSLVAAMLMHHFVEKPAIAWSRKVD